VLELHGFKFEINKSNSNSKLVYKKFSNMKWLSEMHRRISQVKNLTKIQKET